MEILTAILPYIVAIGTFVAGLFTGRRKRNNDFLCDLQKSIDLLSAKNKELIDEVVTLRTEIVKLKSENAALRSEIEELNVKLSNIKTITKTK